MNDKDSAGNDGMQSKARERLVEKIRERHRDFRRTPHPLIRMGVGLLITILIALMVCFLFINPSLIHRLIHFLMMRNIP